jgi:hypothetical protein
MPMRRSLRRGSLSSAVHGVMRATMDADLVADLRLEHVEPLAQALGGAFCANVEVMREASHRHRSFNVIHLETAFKVDVFVAKLRPFDRSQLARRQLTLLSEEPARRAYVTSAEDITIQRRAVSPSVARLTDASETGEEAQRKKPVGKVLSCADGPAYSAGVAAHLEESGTATCLLAASRRACTLDSMDAYPYPFTIATSSARDRIS